MGLESIRILFDNSYGVYFPGQTVEGKVLVKVKGKAKKTKGVEVRFSGRSTVHFEEKIPLTKEEKQKGETKPHVIVCTNNETYFESRIYAFGNGSETTIPSGEHQYKFSFTLPHSLPSSFEGKFGHVRYSARATFLHPKAAKVREINAFFTVNSILDLNTMPNLATPPCVTKEANVGALFWKSGPIQSTLRLDKSGFVPGENLQMNVEIDNSSSKRKIAKAKALLIQETRFMSDGRSRIQSETVATHERGSVNAKEKEAWSNACITIPALPPSDLIHCAIIDVSYRLELHVMPSAMGQPIISQIPLTIGTIPFTSAFNSFSATQQHPEDNAGFPSGVEDVEVPFEQPQPVEVPAAPVRPVRQAPQPPMSNVYPDLPPPSYDESMREKGPVQEAAYSPRYPTYTTKQPY